MDSIAAPRCWCNVTDQYFEPRRVLHAHGACCWCNADRGALTEPDYEQPWPQWHPVLTPRLEARVREERGQ